MQPSSSVRSLGALSATCLRIWTFVSLRSWLADFILKRCGEMGDTGVGLHGGSLGVDLHGRYGAWQAV